MHPFTKRIHLIGIGGAGMSPLAEVLLRAGHDVTGSDRRSTPVTRRLESLGIGVQYDHSPSLIARSELVIYSSAVKEDNPERRYAADHAIPSMRRAELLGELMRAKFSIGIAGTHGKTTTTALTGHLLTEAGKAPTVLVGGTLQHLGSNAVVGDSDLLITEADEYDRSFLALYPTIAVITNIEADHLDCYRDLGDITDSFVSYANRTPFYGAVIMCGDDPGVNGIFERVEKTRILYGLHEQCGYRAERIEFSIDGATFELIRHGAALGEIAIPLTGLHNVRNTLAAVAAASEMGVAIEHIRRACAGFGGVKRRFEIVGQAAGVTAVDDYAHHPSEVAVTIDAARAMGYRRIVAVFQPHLYSRTRDFESQFAQSLRKADRAIVLPIYQAREEPIAGVSAEAIVRRIEDVDKGKAIFAPSSETALEIAARELGDGDVALFMGAGDIGQAAPELLGRLSHG
jgi:UDP-N-acetylmuramate--alanine ligase